jgi:putative hydrolase of the HAD superfamily
MSVQAVFFDMGGTLERFWHKPEIRMQATLGLKERLLLAGINLGMSDGRLFEVILAGYKRYHSWSIDTMEELPPQRVWGEFILAGIPIDQEKLDIAAEDLMVYLENHFYQREMRPEVPAVLEAIKKNGLKIGLISNVCSRDLVPDNLKKYGIIHYFDPIVLSSSYGRRKPDPAIFHYAARLANVPTSECLYIGDRIARDVVGSHRAGFKLAVQIINEFDHGEDDTGAEPDAVIHEMTELLDFLQAESKRSATRPRNHKEIRALLFDAGDILYFRPNRGQHLKNFLKQSGLANRKLHPDAENTLKSQAYHGQITQNQYREELLCLYGVTDPVLLARGIEAMDLDDNNVEVFKGVSETLKSLKKEGFLLAIVTDTAVPLHIKLSWFEHGGFGDVWDSVISSKEMGTQKPDQRIFNAALQQLGVTVAQAVFVGHSPEELDGARAMGMKTIAFNYDEQAKADFYIEEFKDLLRIPALCVEEKHDEVIVK